MTTQFLSWLVASFFLATVAPALAQPQSKIPKIGWLAARPAAPGSGLDLFRREVRALGYVENKNLTIEYRSADNQLDRLPALANELIRLNVDVFVTPGTNEALAAKKATQTIPIVFASSSEPVSIGLIDSLARPGGNVTGFTTIETVLAAKRLELLKETIPKLSRVAVLWNPRDRSSALSWKESQQPARELGLQLHSMEVSSAEQIEGAFKLATKAGNTALAVTQSGLMNSNQKLIANLAIKNRLPTIYNRGDFVASGGLMAYGADRAEPYTRIAVMVDKILRGTKPADIPVEQPTKFELIINLKTAKTLGLTIPPIVLMRVQRVVK